MFYDIISLCIKMAAKRQAQETDSIVSPELSPFCMKAGSIRRSNSRRRRSHRTLSEETAAEAAEEKLDPMDEAVVHYSPPTNKFMIMDGFRANTSLCLSL